METLRVSKSYTCLPSWGCSGAFARGGQRLKWFRALETVLIRSSTRPALRLMVTGGTLVALRKEFRKAKLGVRALPLTHLAT